MAWLSEYFRQPTPHHASINCNLQEVPDTCPRPRSQFLSKQRAAEVTAALLPTFLTVVRDRAELAVLAVPQTQAAWPVPLWASDVC